ncbi:response regulator transcription factor [Humibacter sp.]|uniref:response regulator transcription factor n=1 Tax=Humibacter sp. TaxID=1940291 RepID=UPI003F809074
MIRVLLADDQALIREGFRSILERDPEIDVVGEAADGDSAVRLTRELVPDVVLMDIRMPGIDGIRATRVIAHDPALADVRVLVVTTYELDENVFGALAAGAGGFLLKDIEPDELRRAVHVLAAGDALLAPSVTRRLIGRFTGAAAEVPTASTGARSDELSAQLERLTEREREIVAHIAGGLTNDEIASRLFISPTTVKTHASHAMLKLGARDRAQLVVFAYRAGLVR